MKIFGIGLNKTGTKTLGACLRHFGCRHTTFDLNDLRNFKKGQLQPLLDKLQHFDSCEDWPWPLLFEVLDDHFPEARFILTTRLSPNVWFESLCKHAEKTGPTEGRLLAYGYAMPHLYRKSHLNFYLEHNQRVREHFRGREGKLLELCWEQGDEWMKLCEFLGWQVPKILFPHENRSKK